MKIAIADDEPLIRLSLRNTLVKLGIDPDDIAEAEHGEGLLLLLERERPDIALVDIKMPLMSGLDAVERGKSVSPHTKYVILTGFAEFGYAQKAIELQMADYLLKPVSQGTLNALLEKLRGQLAQELGEANETFAARIAALLSRPDYAEGARAALGGLLFKLVRICADGNGPGHLAAMDAWLHRSRQCMDRFMSRELHLTMIQPRRGEWVIVGACGGQRAGSGSFDGLASFIAEIKRISREIASSDTNFTFITERECTFDRLPAVYDKLNELSCLRAVLGIHRHYSSAYLEQMLAERPAYLEAGRLLASFADACDDRSYVDFKLAEERLAHTMNTAGIAETPHVLKAAALYLRFSIGLRAGSVQDVQRLAAALRDFGEQRLRSGIGKTNLAHSVVRYLDRHFAQDVSVTTVSRLFGLSPNYLSSVFHKTTGKKFVEHLTDLRLEEAK